MSFFTHNAPNRRSSSNLLQRTSSPATTRRRNPLGRSLRFEPLEDRRLLAVFAVTNADDAGAYSLRWAIEQANSTAGADTVEIAASLASQTITLTSGELDLTDRTGTTTITNLGASNVIVSGNNHSRVFYVAANTTAEISGLTITQGYTSDYGGGIYNAGTLTISDSNVFENTAYSYGGGICNAGTLTISDSTISENTASYSDGGGIYNAGTLTISDSTVFENTAYCYGGGIYNADTLTISDSTISENTASHYVGGGIYNAGTLTISHSNVSGNTASHYGGGIYNYGTLTISDSTIAGNTASHYGGGIYNYGTLTISDSNVSENTASYGGGIYNYGVLRIASGDSTSSTSCETITNDGKLIVESGGTLTLSGNYVQNAGAALTIEIGGTSASEQFGLLSISGTAALDGTLNVVLADDYVPTADDTYQIVAFAGVSGAFAAVNTPSIGIWPKFTVEVNSNNVTLNTAPTVTISDPSKTVTASSSITYTVTYADDYFHTSTLVLGDITLNKTGTASGTVSMVADSSTSYTVTISDITGNGTLGITVAAGTASDEAGNLAAAATSTTFLVDNTAPTVTLTVPTLVNTSKPTGSGTVTDSGSGVANGTIAYLDVDTNNDGDFIDASDIRDYKIGTLSGGKLTVTVPYSVPDGTYGLRTRVSDAAGNEGVSATSTMTVSTHPAISNIAVTAKTSADKTTIAWRESGGSYALGTTTLTIDGKKVSVTKETTGKTTATFSYAGVLTAGKHTYTITGADAKGQKSSYTGTLTVTATTPTISNVSSKATTSDKTTKITWKVYDIDGVSSTTLKIDGVKVTSGIKTSGSGKTITYTYTGYVAAGKHKYDVTATDSKNKTAATSGSFTVTATTPTIKNVKVTAKTSADNTTIVWTVYDYDSVKSTTLKIDGVKATSGITQSGSGTTITYTYVGKLTAAKHAYTIDATDAASVAASAKQTKGSFTVAATTPTISKVKVASATTAKTTITWTAYDIDNISDYKLTIDGKTITSGVTQSGSGATVAYTYAGVLKAGSHSYAITATDAQKKSSTASGKFTVTVASVAASAVFATASGATATADWLIDYSSIIADTNEDIVDAVFAAY